MDIADLTGMEAFINLKELGYGKNRWTEFNVDQKYEIREIVVWS